MIETTLRPEVTPVYFRCCGDSAFPDVESSQRGCNWTVACWHFDWIRSFHTSQHFPPPYCLNLGPMSQTSKQEWPEIIFWWIFCSYSVVSYRKARDLSHEAIHRAKNQNYLDHILSGFDFAINNACVVLKCLIQSNVSHIVTILKDTEKYY